MVFQNGNWGKAVSGLSLAAQDVVRTEKASKAELIMDGESRIWLNENSEFKISWLGQESTMDLIVGKIRAKLKLPGGAKFTVKTPVSVVGVRGTELIATDTGELFVLDGTVQFSNADGSSNADVPAGQSSAINAQTGTVSPPAAITPEQQNAINQDWAGFEDMTADGGQTGQPTDAKLLKAAADKEMQAELKREFMFEKQDIQPDFAATRDNENERKENDFSTGRSMRDIHGNLVRIEQQLLRPDSQTMQFVNITERKEYVYKGQFDYSGPSGSRVDIFDASIKFNKILPEQLSDWPRFIGDQKEDEFFPQSMNVKLTNQTDKIEMIGVTREKGQLDEKGNVLTGRSMVADTYINGWKVDTNYDTQDQSKLEYDPADKGIETSGEDTDDLWATAISSKLKLDKPGETSQYVKMYVEGYVINNSGNIMNIKDFTSSSENPFTLLKTVGAEGIISCKTTLGTNFLTKGNIDIIMTPDIVVSIAQKLGSGITDIGDNMRSNTK